jgi:hypothetical protein
MKRSGRMMPLLVGALLLALPAQAQFNTGEDLSITVSPATPRPYDTVMVTPTSNLIDLAASTITVTVNGKVVTKITGSQSVPVTVGGPGERTVISLSAVTGGKTYTNQVALRPADVSLIVEPISTTHPFYRGSALTAPSGRVRLIAIPDLRSNPSTRLNAANLVYTWKLGDQVLQANSGIGRMVLSAQAPVMYRDATITVTVRDAGATVVAETSAVVSPVDAVTRIYHADPLMGPDYDHALSETYTMKGEEEAFRAVGYFFGTTPSLSWSVNGQSASNDRDVTVRTTGTGQGIATLSLSADTADQSAQAALPISFGAKKTNIFGF